MGGKQSWLEAGLQFQHLSFRVAMVNGEERNMLRIKTRTRECDCEDPNHNLEGIFPDCRQTGWIGARAYPY